MSSCKVVTWTLDILGFFWRGKHSLEYVPHLIMQWKGRSRCRNRPASVPDRQSPTRPRKLMVTVLQCGLAGGPNSSFLEKLQATRLENTLRLESSLVVELVWFWFWVFFSWWWFVGVGLLVGWVGLGFFPRNIFPHLCSILAMTFFYKRACFRVFD